jgi:hypothetical protein
MTWLLFTNLTASSALLAHSMCILNRMNRKSNHFYRAGYVLLGVGALAVLAGPLYGYRQPQPAEVLFNIGTAFVMIVGWFTKDRRAL